MGIMPRISRDRLRLSLGYEAIPPEDAKAGVYERDHASALCPYYPKAVSPTTSSYVFLRPQAKIFARSNKASPPSPLLLTRARIVYILA